MSTLPFEDLPLETDYFDAIFWPPYPLKVGKKDARKALKKALTRADIITIIGGLAHYMANKPAWKEWMHAATFLNGDHWEDEYDTPHRAHAKKSHAQLQVIAEHARRSWCRRGDITPEDLQACVDAGLLSVERMEEVT